ncbi:MAG: uracil-DNA glycosylase family protein [Brevinema sp.]
MEKHLLEPFIPEELKVLMLGSFPPKKEKWTMDFYYPNFQNDMWRIFGIVFFDNHNYFLKEDHRAFDLIKICNFLVQKKIGVADAAQEVIRLNDSASDKYLQLVQSLDLNKILSTHPSCRYLITTGEKSAEMLKNYFGLLGLPTVGGSVVFEYQGREITLYRVPSSSRAYPKPLMAKAEIYREVWKNILF